MSTSAPDPAPFDLLPKGRAVRPAAVLCLHGLTGTPYEVRPIAEELVGRGMRARGPVLPGHGSSPADLAELPYRAWLDAVRSEYRQLRRDHAQVYVVGLSLGGLLTLALAADHEVEAAAVIGTPIRFRSAINALVGVGRFVYRMMPKRDGSDIHDRVARRVHPGYNIMPAPSVYELIRLQRVVRAKLHRVRAPLLVAHGRLDSTANPADLEEIAAGVASDSLATLYLERSAHVVPVDHDGPQLAAAIGDFFEAEVGDASPERGA